MQTIPFPDPGRPDTRSTTRFMLWVGRQQWRTQTLGMLAGMLWMLAIALVPAAVGKGVDEGIVPGDLGGLVRWALALIGLGAVCAAMAAVRHYFAVYNWLFASYRGAQLTAEAAERAGPALTRTMPSGEVVAVFANDVMRLGGLYDVMGRFAGAVVSYAVVGAILLAASPALGWLVLLGGPVMLASLSLIVRPLQRRQARQREEAGRLTTLGADTVAGLRVLRGIGGEQTFLRRYEQQSARVRERGFQVAGIQAALDSAEVLHPWHLRGPRDLARRQGGGGRRPHGRAAGRVLRLHRLPHDAAADRHRGRRPCHPGADRCRQDAARHGGPPRPRRHEARHRTRACRGRPTSSIPCPAR